MQMQLQQITDEILWKKEKLLMIRNYYTFFSKSSAADLKYVGKGKTYLLNPFPHTTILQQTTLNVFCQNIENLHN